MLGRRLRRWLPGRHIIKDNKSLRIFGEHLHNGRVWHTHRESVARALAIGLFCCFLPIPFQMVLAAALSVIFYANLPLSVILVWISNPITMPAMFYAAYKLGTYLMQQPPLSLEGKINFDWLFTQLNQIWLPMLIGCLLLGCFFGIAGYYFVQFVWRIWILHHWRKRQEKRRQSKKRV